MLYAVVGFCAAICAFAFCRYIATKMMILDIDKRELDTRRLLDEIRADEVQALKEQNVIMRNLLLDMIENEASLAGTSDNTPQSERTLRNKNRIARRRELFGEAVVLFDEAAAPRIKIPQVVQ